MWPPLRARAPNPSLPTSDVPSLQPLAFCESLVSCLSAKCFERFRELWKVCCTRRRSTCAMRAAARARPRTAARIPTDRVACDGDGGSSRRRCAARAADEPTQLSGEGENRRGSGDVAAPGDRAHARHGPMGGTVRQSLVRDCGGPHPGGGGLGSNRGAIAGLEKRPIAAIRMLKIALLD